MNEQFLVFDIETSGYDWDSLSEKQQEYLTRNAKTEEDKEKAKFELALYPYTSNIVCIGLQLMEIDSDGKINMINKAAFMSKVDVDDEYHEFEELSDGSLCHYYTERKMLEQFWSIMTKYKGASLVSFNGRNFDAPFLMLRSATLGIRPSKNLMSGTKFNYPNHFDLIDELTFYSAGSYGPTRKFNFDFYAQAYGIKSPKSEGVDGSMVGTLYKAGELKTIAEYCLRDVTATWELYLIWRNYLKF